MVRALRTGRHLQALRRSPVAAALALAILCGVVVPSRAFAYTDHVVQAGETLSQIANRYGFPVDTLLDVNGLSDPDAIHEGQVLRIPGWGEAAPSAPASAEPGTTVSYVVQSGDVLSAIAVSHGSTVKAVVELNGLADANAIHEGQVLQVPAASPAPAASELPAPTATLKHEVRPGETLSHIADGYGVTVQALVEANSLATADAIVVGQVLLVPGQAAPAPATVAVRTPTRTHTVLAGETLSMIAEHYGFSAQELAALNGLSDAGLIVEGEPLLIPAGPPPPGHAPGRRHTVSAGETLAEIAAQYRVAVDAIVDANGLASPDLLVVGQYLTIPASGSRQKLPRAEYDRVLAAAADEFGISRALVKAVAWQESGWNQDIVSHANAYGLMQIIPSTAQWALETLVHDAPNWDISHIDNARMGAAILRDHLIRTDWDVSIALAAYYQGFEALRKVGMYEDTKEYVASISALIPQFE